jgi:hypothetical protein
VPTLYLILVVLWCAVQTWRPLYGYQDFWAHAAVGRWTCEHRAVPDHTLYLWTASQPWVYHHWLSEVVLYGLTRLGEGDALAYVVNGFVLVLVVVPFLLAWDLWARRGRITAWVLLPFVWGVEAAAPRFQARPELFTMLFLALLFRFLAAWSAGPAGVVSRADRLRAAAVVLMFAVWANCHGMVAVGLFLLGVSAACDLAQDRLGHRARVLALLVPLAALAMLATPYGLTYWRAYLPVGGETLARVTEWQPVWKLIPIRPGVVAEAGAVAALALLAWALNPGRRWAHLAWLVVACGLFVSAGRHVWVLVLVSLLVAAANAGALDPAGWWQALRRRFGARAGAPLPLRGLVAGVLTAWLLMQLWACWTDKQQMGPLWPASLAGGAVRFFRDHRTTGHVLNDYENAGFLNWCLDGEPPLFIDCMNAYPDGVTRDYVDMMSVSRRGRELLADDRLDWVVLTTNRVGDSAVRLADYLDSDRHWMRVYAGDDGVIWVRRTPEAERRWEAEMIAVQQTPFAILETYNLEPTW